MSDDIPRLLTPREIQEFRLYMLEVEKWISYYEHFFIYNQFYYHIADRPEDMDQWDEDVFWNIFAIYTLITDEYEHLREHLNRFSQFIPRMEHSYEYPVQAIDRIDRNETMPEDEATEAGRRESRRRRERRRKARERVITRMKRIFWWSYMPYHHRRRLMGLSDRFRSWIERFEHFQQDYDRIQQIGMDEWRREWEVKRQKDLDLKAGFASNPWSPTPSESGLPPSTPASPLPRGKYNVPGLDFGLDIDVNPDPRPLTREEMENFKMYRLQVMGWIKEANDKLDLYQDFFYKSTARPQDIDKMDLEALHNVFTELREEVERLTAILQTLNEYANRWDATFSGREPPTEELWWDRQLDSFRWELSDLKRHYHLWIERFDVFKRGIDRIGHIGVDEWVRQRQERRLRDQNLYSRSEVSREEYEKTLKEGITSAGKRRRRQFHEMLSMDRDILPKGRDEDEIGVTSDTRSDRTAGSVHRLVQMFENLGVNGSGARSSGAGGSGAGGSGAGSSGNPLLPRVRNIEARIAFIQRDIDRAKLYSGIENLEEYPAEDIGTLFQALQDFTSIPNRVQTLRQEFTQIAADNRSENETRRRLDMSEDQALDNRIQTMGQSLDSLENLYNTEGSDIEQTLELMIESVRTDPEYGEYSNKTEEERESKERWADFYDFGPDHNYDFGPHHKVAPGHADVLPRLWPHWPENPNDWNQELIDTLDRKIDEIEQSVRPHLDREREQVVEGNRWNDMTYEDFCREVPLPNEPLGEGEEPVQFAELRQLVSDLRDWAEFWFIYQGWFHQDGLGNLFDLLKGKIPQQWKDGTVMYPFDPNNEDDLARLLIRVQGQAVYKKFRDLETEMAEPIPGQLIDVFSLHLQNKIEFDIDKWLKRERELNANVLPGMTEEERREVRRQNLEQSMEHFTGCDCMDCVEYGANIRQHSSDSESDHGPEGPEGPEGPGGNYNYDFNPDNVYYGF